MIYLGGGGSEEDESQIWDLVFAPTPSPTPNPNRHIVIAIWPQAQPPSRHPSVISWFTTALSSRPGSSAFTILPSSSTTPPHFGLDTADILFIPGGNTFHLLQFMREHDLLTAVRAFIARGGKVFGGSAGALVLGADIGICDVKNGGLDVNDIEMEDTQALGLLGGKGVVYPHFEGGETEQGGVCQRWADGKGWEVIAMPERCGVVVDGDGVAMNAGPEEVWVYGKGREVRRYKEGESWRLE